MSGSGGMAPSGLAPDLQGSGNAPRVRGNTPAKPMSAPVDMLKSAGFLLPGERHAVV